MRRGLYIFRHVILLFFLAIGGYPLIWMLFSALRTEGAILENPFGLPTEPVLHNFVMVLKAGDFLRAYGNSLFICGVSVICAVFLASMAAFAFAKFSFGRRELLFLLILAGMMVPIHVTLIPLNHLMGSSMLNLKGTYLVLIAPYVGFALPVSVLILRSAFRQVPEDLLEAARLDGCSAWGIYWRIMLPLSKPALATVTIFNALTMWNEFAFALTLINERELRTLPLALWQFKGEYGMYISQTCAALCVSIVPLLIIYFFAQRHIISGLTAGALKE